jgi:Fur family ferric uptake transcriptional regulator
MSEMKHHDSPNQQQSLTEQAWRQFVSFLKHQGDRVTRARRIVFESVFDRHDHFRADDLANDLSYGPNRVSRGTIYRTLALMSQAGLVREIRDADTHTHYEHTFGHEHHEHLLCRACGSFIEFRDDTIRARIDAICNEASFLGERHSLVISGLCKPCRMAGRGQT